MSIYVLFFAALGWSFFLLDLLAFVESVVARATAFCLAGGA